MMNSFRYHYLANNEHDYWCYSCISTRRLIKIHSDFDDQRYWHIVKIVDFRIYTNQLTIIERS